MRLTLSIVGILLSCFLIVASRALAEPIEWLSSNGGNGHAYERVTGNFTWGQARSAATARAWQGLKGHLVTITSQQEQDWVAQQIAIDTHSWLGGYQLAGSIEPGGGWRWVTNEPWAYMNWGTGEPNNANGNEAYLGYSESGPSAFSWNDALDSDPAITNMIVEYESIIMPEQADGTIWAWGNPMGWDFGQTIPPPINRNFVAITAGFAHSIGLQSDGSIVAWGWNGYGQCIEPIPNSNIIAVSGGYIHSLYLKSDGSIVAKGYNISGECTVPEPNTDFIAIVAGSGFSLGLKANGSIEAWGINNYGQIDVPDPNTDFVAIASGYCHCLGIKSNGSIVAWGWNEYGQCDVPGPNTEFISVAGGYHHSLGLKSDGSIVAWGAGGVGQSESPHYGQSIVPSPNQGFVAIAAGSAHSLGLKADGAIVAWGQNYYDQISVPEPNTSFVAVAGGSAHSLGLKQAFKLEISDVLNDEGGQLRISWHRHSRDVSSSTSPITVYDIQQHQSDWQTLSTTVAAYADSYFVIIDTPDILTLGQPAPHSRYRVVARTTDPLVYYESVVDSCYSIDNLPPDVPVLELYDSPTSRVLVWQNPGVIDFYETCIFRGSTPGFVPDTPLACSSGTYLIEPDRFFYWYKARSFDIHGNASEWSNEVVGQYPTGVPGAMPTVLRLYPNQPNPFNPLTTIKYGVPVDGRATLRIYDVRGALVRTLIDADLPRGTHQATWDGRDASGRGMASGSYFARLEAGGRGETVRMSLVR